MICCCHTGHTGHWQVAGVEVGMLCAYCIGQVAVTLSITPRSGIMLSQTHMPAQLGTCHESIG